MTCVVKVTYGKGFAPCDPLPLRDRILRLEDEIAKLPPAECPVRHIFAPGVYMREMTVPAGVTAVGAVHKTKHATIISAGHCYLMTDGVVKEFRAPQTIVSEAGVKRAIYAVETTVITTIHPTDEVDLDKLCHLLVESHPDELIGGPRNKQVLANKSRLAELEH